MFIQWKPNFLYESQFDLWLSENIHPWKTVADISKSNTINRVPIRLIIDEVSAVPIVLVRTVTWSICGQKHQYTWSFPIKAWIPRGHHSSFLSAYLVFIWYTGCLWQNQYQSQVVCNDCSDWMARFPIGGHIDFRIPKAEFLIWKSIWLSPRSSLIE